MTTKRNRRHLLPALIAVTSLFFMWGFITVLADGLIPRLKEVFELKHWQAATVQVAWFVPYGLLSIPAGAMLARLGYKRGIILGLLTAGVGCGLFYPAAEIRMFWLFLTAIFVLGSGITVLQVAANPYVTVLGPPAGAAKRLNLAQAFNSLGTTIAPAVATGWLLSDRIMSGVEIEASNEASRQAYLVAEAAAVQTPFLFLAGAFTLLALLFMLVRLPVLLGSVNGGRSRYREAFSHRRLRFGALAIFVYVGAEVAIGSFLTLYFLDLGLAGRIIEHDTLSAIVNRVSVILSGKALGELDEKGVVGAFAVFYWGSAMLGRFAGAALMTMIQPRSVLRFFAIGASVLLLISMNTVGFTAMLAILAVGFFNSVMFPTIFSLSIDELGDLKPEGSGILCTAIVGGAFIPPLVGMLRDLTETYQLAFLVPLACYTIVMLFSFHRRG